MTGYCTFAISNSLVFGFFVSGFACYREKQFGFLGRDLNSIFLHCHHLGHSRSNYFCSTIPADACPDNHH